MSDTRCKPREILIVSGLDLSGFLGSWSSRDAFSMSALERVHGRFIQYREVQATTNCHAALGQQPNVPL